MSSLPDDGRNSLTYLSSVLAYVCGHEACWPSGQSASCKCYGTSQELYDHWKVEHSDDATCERPYRCGLPGCGKGWKVSVDHCFVKHRLFHDRRALMVCNIIFSCKTFHSSYHERRFNILPTDPKPTSRRRSLPPSRCNLMWWSLIPALPWLARRRDYSHVLTLDA